MKRIFVLIFFCSIVILVLFLGANFVFAAAANCKEYCANPSLGQPVGSTCICNPLSSPSFEDLIGKISIFLVGIGSAVAGVMFTIAAFMWVIAGGSPERVKTAQKMILYTAIGLAILLLASGLAQLLKSILGVK